MLANIRPLTLSLDRPIDPRIAKTVVVSRAAMRHCTEWAYAPARTAMRACALRPGDRSARQFRAGRGIWPDTRSGDNTPAVRVGSLTRRHAILQDADVLAGAPLN
jgi:hypothetical protein